MQFLCNASSLTPRVPRSKYDSAHLLRRNLANVIFMTDSPRQYVRSAELLSRDDSRLLIVDMQQKLLPLISVADETIGNCRRLIRGAEIFSVPVFATEQYPRGLGKTVPDLAELLASVPEKQRFSCAEVLNWGTATEQTDGRHRIVVAGIETHVCVQHTALDLLAQGYRVYIPADATSSRGKLDWKIALGRLADAGATITTTESILFEWCETSAAPEFKQISDLIKSG